MTHTVQLTNRPRHRSETAGSFEMTRNRRVNNHPNNKSGKPDNEKQQPKETVRAAGPTTADQTNKPQQNEIAASKSQPKRRSGGSASNSHEDTEAERSGTRQSAKKQKCDQGQAHQNLTPNETPSPSDLAVSESDMDPENSEDPDALAANTQQTASHLLNPATSLAENLQQQTSTATAAAATHQPPTMHLITSEQLALIKKALADTITHLQSNKTAKVDRLNAASDLQTAAKILSGLPTNQQTNKPDLDKVLSKLVNEIQLLKKSINKPTGCSSGSAYNSGFPPLPKVNQCDRTCIIEPGTGVSFADVIRLKNDPKMIADNVRITNIVTSKSGKHVVKLASETDQQKFLTHCQINNVTARKMQPKLTRFMIKGVPDTEQYATEQQITDEMFTRHEHGPTLRKSYRLFKLFKTGNDKKTLVFYLDDEGSRLLQANRDFWLGPDRHRACPYVHPIQCFGCFEMGHISEQCPHRAEAGYQMCGRCGILGHDHRACQSNEKRCSACDSIDELKNNAHNHCARDGVCPVKRRWFRDQQNLVWT